MLTTCLTNAQRPVWPGYQRCRPILSRKRKPVVAVVATVARPAENVARSRHQRDAIRYSNLCWQVLRAGKPPNLHIVQFPPSWKSPYVKRVATHHWSGQTILLYGPWLPQLPFVRQFKLLWWWHGSLSCKNGDAPWITAKRPLTHSHVFPVQGKIVRRVNWHRIAKS